MSMTDLWRLLRAVWSYDLLVLDGQAIRVGAVMAATGLIAAGWALSRRASQALERLLTSRFHLEVGAAAAIETLAFYAFFAGVVITGLRLVHFPLTAFTIAGGALFPRFALRRAWKPAR